MAKYKGYLKSHRPRCPKCGSPKTLRTCMKTLMPPV
jgi:hypothetical protein